MDAAWRHGLLWGCVPMEVTHYPAALCPVGRQVSGLTRPRWGWLLLLPSEVPSRMGEGLGERQAAKVESDVNEMGNDGDSPGRLGMGQHGWWQGFCVF